MAVLHGGRHIGISAEVMDWSWKNQLDEDEGDKATTFSEVRERGTGCVRNILEDEVIPICC